MTREEATQNIDEIDFLTWQIDIIEDMLDQIFNDHEAQLRAKGEKLQQLDDAYSKVASNLESAVMEIERLKNYSCNNCVFQRGRFCSLDIEDTCSRMAIDYYKQKAIVCQ